MLNDSQDPRSHPAIDGGGCMEREEKGDERGREEIRKRFRDMEEIEAIERQRH